MGIVKYKFLENATLKPLLSIAVVALFALTVLLVLNPAVATPNENASDKAKDETKFVIPENAKEIAPGVFHLGKFVSEGQIVEGIAIFHHRAWHGEGPGGGNGDEESSCYAFLINGYKWKKVEPWIVNAQNSPGLSDDFVLSNIELDIQKWEDAASRNILGEGSLTTAPLAADLVWPTDAINEVYFDDIASPGAVGVTIVWYTSLGNKLIEWDMVLDDVDYGWTDSSIDGMPGMIDFENVVTHELGHATGMGHPDDSCTEETMFRFISLAAGETKKRDLNAGDIAGINALY